jgi:hypothetical protein
MVLPCSGSNHIINPDLNIGETFVKSLVVKHRYKNLSSFFIPKAAFSSEKY